MRMLSLWGAIRSMSEQGQAAEYQRRVAAMAEARHRQEAWAAINNQRIAKSYGLTSGLENYPYEPWPLDMAGSAPRDADDVQALAYDPSAYPHFLDLPTSAAA